MFIHNLYSPTYIQFQFVLVVMSIYNIYRRVDLKTTRNKPYRFLFVSVMKIIEKIEFSLSLFKANSD